MSSMGALAQVKLGDPAPPLLGYNKTGEKILVPDLKGKVGVKGIPHMVISRDGNIKKIFRGYSEESLPDVVEEVANALNE